MHVGVGFGRGLHLDFTPDCRSHLNVEIWWIFMMQCIALQICAERKQNTTHDAGFKPSVNYPESKKGFNCILQIPSRS
jgi:hypothetical protein